MFARLDFLKETSHSPSTGDSPPWDTVLAETERFVVVPSLGSLVPGWLLVVPKLPALALGDLPNDFFPELESLVIEVKETLSTVFQQPTIVWENGAASRGAKLGCGVDHAHLHIVPFKMNLVSQLSTVNDRELNWSAIHSLSSLTDIRAESKSYLFVEGNDGCRSVSINPNVPGQLARRVIATSIGKPHLYDWRVYHGNNEIRETVDLLSTRFVKTINAPGIAV